MHLSSGSLSAAGARRQREKGIEDSAEAHFADSLRISHGTGDQTMIRLWQENAADTLEWLFEIGLQVPDQEPSLNAAHEFYSAPRTYTPVKGALSYLEVFTPLLEAEIARGAVTLMLDVRMTSLLRNEAGAVIGVATRGKEGQERKVFARSVLLTTGGYASSEALWRELHDLPKQVYAYPHALGDGLRAARAEGAKVSKGENFLPTFGALKDIDEPDKIWIGSRIMPVIRQPWEIWVDAHGRRFIAEDTISPDRRERALLRLGDMYCWQIYDARIRRDSPPLWTWPQEKVERAFASDPDYIRADSVDDLARAMGVDAKVLKATVGTYNAGQAVGSDEFARQYMPLPIGESPFYAVKMYGTSVVSWAGLVTNESLQVLDEDDRPIPNLYAAGEILGMGTFGHAFLGGSTISSSITFGRLLGDRILSW